MSPDAASDLDVFLRQALAEDVGAGDVTSNALLDAELRARGMLRLREEGVVAGIGAALRVFELLEPGAAPVEHAAEGEVVGAGALVGEVRASARAVLAGERLALNLLGRLSGIATLTRRFVHAVEGTGVDIVDTRKTTPLLRRLEKDAVRAGGGTNHRMGLYDAVLVKDNHLDLLGASGSAAGMKAATEKARRGSPAGMFVQIEARTAEEAVAAATAGADSILLDNFAPRELKSAVTRVRAAMQGRRILLEASGGITLRTARRYALAGVDRISIGALTHSADALDVTMEMEALRRP
ncbi:MAG: carboxylating nicotinate-nucleotide diphosphorylase [Planctomycetes bacterium]|nr:carboxylating nicotinate-nucleotide diphosphorylase [Planctomycetota bacterium]